LLGYFSEKVIYGSIFRKWLELRKTKNVSRETFFFHNPFSLYNDKVLIIKLFRIAYEQAVILTVLD